MLEVSVMVLRKVRIRFTRPIKAVSVMKPSFSASTTAKMFDAKPYIVKKCQLHASNDKPVPEFQQAFQYLHATCAQTSQVLVGKVEAGDNDETLPNG